MKYEMIKWERNPSIAPKDNGDGTFTQTLTVTCNCVGNTYPDAMWRRPALVNFKLSDGDNIPAIFNQGAIDYVKNTYPNTK